MVNGSKPTDGGNLLFSNSEKEQLLKAEPMAASWLRPFSMGEEFISGEQRWCLWLKDCPPNTLRQMPAVMARVEAVKKMRIAKH